MRKITTTVRHLLQDKAGNIAISAALASPLLVVILALGVDFGHLTIQRREIQNAADLSAISAAADMTNAEKAVLNHFSLNNLKLGVKTPNGMLTENGLIPFNPDIDLNSGLNGYAVVTKGQYVPDPNLTAGQRFVAGNTAPNAIKVEILEKGQIFFAGSFATPPVLSATGTAATTRIASFSVASRLLSLDGGLLNGILGGLLGTTVSLNVMDYRALLDANINLLHVIEALSLDLNLTAGTYKDVLSTNITYGQFLNALTKVTGLQPTVTAALKTLEKSLNKTQLNLHLDQILNMGPLSDRLIGTGENLKITASIFELLSAAAVAANQKSQIALDLGVNVLGLASLKVNLAIGEPPIETPQLAVGEIGSIVRTAQTRLSVDLNVDGLSAIAGLKVRVPLYVNVAYAEARLADIRCTSAGQASVDIEVVPGVAEIALGSVDTTAFSNFGKTPRVTEVAVVDSGLLRIKGMALIDTGNQKKTKVTFAQQDITKATVKTVSSQDTATSLVQSLLKNLKLTITLLPDTFLGQLLTIQTPTLILNALADTLAIITKPVDAILYNTLLVLGVRIGEADVRVTDARCMSPALVQ